MSGQKTIKPSDLAHHWGCSPANVSNLVKRRGMPAFCSLAEADAWRAVNAPARKTPQSSANNLAASGEKIAGFSATTTPRPTPKRAEGQQDNPPQAPPVKIDVAQFVDHGADFVALQLQNAKEIAQIAHGLLKLKMADGDPGAIAAAAKNWHEASKAAADIIEKFLVIQREAGTLIPLDDVEDVIATELEEIRKGLKRLGQRAAPAANPEKPLLAEHAINGEVDKLLAKFNNLTSRVRVELATEEEPPLPDEPEASPAPDLDPPPAPGAP